MKNINNLIKTNKIKIIAIILILVFSSYINIVNAQFKPFTETDYDNPNKIEEFSKLRSNDLINYEQNGWKFCGPSIINSTGMGLHMAFFNRYSVLSLAGINLIPVNRWWFVCKYWNPRANTVIEPIPNKLKEKIELNGRHIVIAGIFISPSGLFFGGQIPGMILNRILDKSNNNILNNLFGTAIWKWNWDPDLLMKIFGFSENLSKIISFLSIIPHLVRNLLIFFRPLKIPIYGFYNNLNFNGYTPFVLYKKL